MSKRFGGSRVAVKGNLQSQRPLLPTFIVGGAGKSGTTTIDQVLRCHPDVGMSRVKEPCYFCWEDLDADRNHFATKSLIEYKRHFADHAGKIAIGEVSPHYLGRPKAAQRIRELLPECKLIFVLRNPIERAFSLYMHFRRDSVEPEADFLRALEGSRFSWNYTVEGRYAELLETYLCAFSESQIKVMFFDDMKKDGPRFFGELFSFIGVRQDVPLGIIDKVQSNVSGLPQNPVLGGVLKVAGRPGVRGIARKWLPAAARNLANTHLHRWMARDLKKLPMPTEARTWLCNYYSDDLMRLSRMTGRKLDHWLAP